MIRKIALIICLSSLFGLLTGCLTTDNNKNTWLMPKKPETIPVPFVKQQDGYFIRENDAKTLADNIDEMKAYEKKLEILIDRITNYYGDKTRINE